jgi:hypothetical protein
MPSRFGNFMKKVGLKPYRDPEEDSILTELRVKNNITFFNPHEKGDEITMIDRKIGELNELFEGLTRPKIMYQDQIAIGLPVKVDSLPAASKEDQVIAEATRPTLKIAPVIEWKTHIDKSNPMAVLWTFLSVVFSIFLLIIAQMDGGPAIIPNLERSKGFNRGKKYSKNGKFYTCFMTGLIFAFVLNVLYGLKAESWITWNAKLWGISNHRSLATISNIYTIPIAAILTYLAYCKLVGFTGYDGVLDLPIVIFGLVIGSAFSSFMHTLLNIGGTSKKKLQIMCGVLGLMIFVIGCTTGSYAKNMSDDEIQKAIKDDTLDCLKRRILPIEIDVGGDDFKKNTISSCINGAASFLEMTDDELVKCMLSC